MPRPKTSTLYAEGTTVAVSKTVEELRRLLTGKGATEVRVGFEPGGGRVLFELKGHPVFFEVVVPPKTDRRFTHDHNRRPRPQAAVDKARDLEERRLWRVLLGALKMKFAAVEGGLLSLEQEFLAHYVVPEGNGATVGSLLIPQLSAPESPLLGALRTAAAPALLLGAPGPDAPVYLGQS
jgi:hypothetical protein